MSEDASIRRENLKRLKLGPQELSDRIGGRYSYWRDMLYNEKKPFGEKAARKIEERLALPRGCLDEANNAVAPSEMEPMAWPFPNIPPRKLAELPQEQRNKVEEAILFMLFKLETRGEDENTPLLFIPSPNQPTKGGQHGKVTAIQKKGKPKRSSASGKAS